MNVLIINCVCSNTGDAAILQAAMAVMRKAWGDAVEFVVQDDHPERVQKLYPQLAARASCYWSLAYTAHEGLRGDLIRRCRRRRFAWARRLGRGMLRALANRLLTDAERGYLDAYRRADVVVATGGTYLVEQYDLGQRLFDMQTAVALDKPLLLFTQSLGPFRSPANRRRLGRLLRAARLILLRDRRSEDHLRQFKLPEERRRIVPDGAFALADDDLTDRPLNLSPLAKPRPRIAVSVRRWDHYADESPQEGMRRYGAAFAALTTHLVGQHDADVVFLSTCQGAPGYHDDSHLAAAISATLPEGVRGRVHVDGDFHTPMELIDQLRQFDWVVSTRMHLAILALGVGTPVLPIAYEFKTTELFKSLGYEQEPPHIESLTSDSLIAAFEATLTAYRRTACHVNEAVDRIRRQAWEVAEILREEFPEFASATPGEAALTPRGRDAARTVPPLRAADKPLRSR